ncbi:hypothetical protein EYF80_024377 [Liparis tanakae]|uniref:Uncharacterized protein n=1 Tax=Liparis tanakae TaxID=230148 RepID=A0A4Z2HI41_9TELE|nr:hypothetical protein EYF80_024377 [Liparis tanakae]
MRSAFEAGGTEKEAGPLGRRPDSPPGSGVFQDNLISFGMGLASQKVVPRISQSIFGLQVPDNVTKIRRPSHQHHVIVESDSLITAVSFS